MASAQTNFSFGAAAVPKPVLQPAAPVVVAEPSPSPSPRATVGFPAFPGDRFFFSVSTDKLEMVVSVENKRSKDQWECRVDDEALKKCGPEGVEIPRAVVAKLLSETLDKMKQPAGDVKDVKANPSAAGGHSVNLQPDEFGGSLVLVLALDFGAGWSPVYRLVLNAKEVKTEDRLRAQIVDLQEEMAQMRAQMQKMEGQLALQAVKCQATRHRH